MNIMKKLYTIYHKDILLALFLDEEHLFNQPLPSLLLTVRP